MVYRRDTIAAIATASGPAAIAMIRVSGPDAATIAAKMFRGRPPARWQPRRFYVGRLVDEAGRTLDRGLAVIMRAPRSYTGEDVVELHCHGGVLLARRLLGAVLAAGARAAEPGEFTLRAFLNGKLDLAQAESVADLISARTEGALRVAVEQLDGSLSRAVEAWRERLVGIAARLEVAIDFSEEDVGELDRGELATAAREIALGLGELASTYGRGRILRSGIRVAIIGKPNAGKSSLLNRLLGMERAIVTAIPGTTRDVIEEAIDVGGVSLVLVDTAGIRANAEEIERLGIERTRCEVDQAEIVIVVLDGSRGWEREDAEVYDATRHKKRILLINKEDLPNRLALPESLVPGQPVIRASALVGTGLAELKAEMLRMVDISADGASGLTVTRERHYQALATAEKSVERAVESLSATHPPDIIAVDIMAALDHLGEIVGRTSPEAVLDRVFREFCIGK